MRPAELAIVVSTRADLAAGRAETARKAAGLSRAEVAKALKVSRQSVANWETGGVVPVAENALAYGRLLARLGKGAA